MKSGERREGCKGEGAGERLKMTEREEGRERKEG